MTILAPSPPPEFSLPIDRADTRDLEFEFAQTVNATELIDLTGNSFRLDLFDPRGTLVLSLAETPVGTRLSFAVSLRQRALLEGGKSGRFELLRLFGETQEPWARGNTVVKGAAYA